MAAYTVEVKSIGTANRDFATITLWEATGSGTNNKGQIGEVFADSDFDERPNLNTSGAVDVASDIPILRAAAGQRPVIKPTSNGDIFAVTNMYVHGLKIDGTNQTSGIGIKITGGGLALVSGCEVQNCAGDGIQATALNLILLCLCHNNGGIGINTGANQSAVVLCGAAKNGGIGIRSSSGFTDMRSCWSLDNTGLDVETVDLTDTRFMYISDTSITDQGAPTFPDDIFESQASAALGFVDFANDNYRLDENSLLRLMGGLFSQALLKSNVSLRAPQIRFDVFGNSLVPQFGDRYDVGPHQPSHIATPAGAGRIFTIGVI